MKEFNEQENERIDFMKAIAFEVSKNEKSAILKGGTSLLLTRGLDRFSEDMDFDLTPGTVTDFQKHILKAAESVKLDIDCINVKKNTETTKRYMVHYQSAFTKQPDVLKIECSMRHEIEEKDAEIIQGLRVYSIARMAELKTAAFIGRDKARDTYDVAFLVANYPSEIRVETWNSIKEHVQNRGIDCLCDSFNKEQDELLEKFEGTEVVLRIQESLDRYAQSIGSLEEEKSLKADWVTLDV
ncbi:MAG: nucleotidyl transferase AbiEii/AbiGii toxin family protein [Synergistaceae bacterium]|nr:nucleotidyl transferase AbiEii/AbiGii toxin family protein [Synergistaceae bacterium]